VQSQIALESARSREDNPTLQALRDRAQNLQTLLRQESTQVLGKAVDDITVLEARQQAIDQAKGVVTQQLQQFPALARQYTDLQRELKIATNSLNEFLSKREALQIDGAQKESPWELISPPTLERDPLTLKPTELGRAWRYPALAVLLSMILGVGAGFLVESLSNAYHTVKDLKQKTRLPILGEIPFVAPAAWQRTPPEEANGAQINGSQTANAGMSPQAIEAFRSLYKNIGLFKGVDSPIRSIAISSAEAGDGKTTIAVNLAHAAAAMGKRVLLVDADLRRPQVHNLLGLSNQYGLSDIITSNRDVRSVLQQSPIREKLMILTAGQIPDDPVEVLSSTKMHMLMERFQMVFDLVIYDTPPLVGLADSSLIAVQVSGLVLVVRLGQTKQPSMTQALDELKLSSTVVLGVVANASQQTYRVPYSDYYRNVETQEANSV
jgi:capsular exopolysaccharide synthesis family protein